MGHLNGSHGSSSDHCISTRVLHKQAAKVLVEWQLGELHSEFPSSAEWAKILIIQMVHHVSTLPHSFRKSKHCQAVAKCKVWWPSDKAQQRCALERTPDHGLQIVLDTAVKAHIKPLHLQSQCFHSYSSLEHFQRPSPVARALYSQD